MKILLLDDEIYSSEVEKVLVKELRNLNYKLDLVYKIESAINKLSDTVYDVIILDIMMPYKDTSYTFDETEGGIKTGYIFLKDFLIERKYSERNVNKPVIIFTNHSDFNNEFNEELKNYLPYDSMKNVFIVNKPYYHGVIDKIKSIK